MASTPTSPIPLIAAHKQEHGVVSPSKTESPAHAQSAVFSPVSTDLSAATSVSEKGVIYDDGLVPYNHYAEQEVNKEIVDSHTREARAPEVYRTYPYYAGDETDPAKEEELARRRKRRKAFIIAAAVILLIIIAVGASVGGVLGARAARKSKNQSTQSPANTTTANSTTPATAIIPVDRTGLATAPRPDGLGMLMYWQASNGSIIESFIPNENLNGTGDNFNFAIATSNVVPLTAPGAALGSQLSAVSYTWNNTQIRQLFFVTPQNNIMQITAQGSSTLWSAPAKVTNDLFTTGAQGLTACASTSGFLKGIRLYYGSGTAIYQVTYDFTTKDDMQQPWTKVSPFLNSQGDAGVGCSIYKVSSGHSIINAYTAADKDFSWQHWWVEYGNTSSVRALVDESSINNNIRTRIRQHGHIAVLLDDTADTQFMFWQGPDDTLRLASAPTGNPPGAIGGTRYILGTTPSNSIGGIGTYYVNGAPLVVTQRADKSLRGIRVTKTFNVLSNGTFVL